MRISDWSSDVCASCLGAFRIVRDSDIEVEEEAEDLVRYFRNALQRRRRGRVIRLKLERGMPSDLTALLLDSLTEGDAIITEVDGIIGIGDVSQLVDCDRPALKFLPYRSVEHTSELQSLLRTSN